MKTWVVLLICVAVAGIAFSAGHMVAKKKAKKDDSDSASLDASLTVEKTAA